MTTNDDTNDTHPAISDLLVALTACREQAADLTAAMLAGEPDALDEIVTFLHAVDEAFLEPLEVAYARTPIEQRCWSQSHDMQIKESFADAIYGLAGAFPLSSARDVAMDWGDLSEHSGPLDEAALRYRRTVTT